MAKTAKQIIDSILKATGAPRLGATVDTIKQGDPATVVTGMVTTFLATREVIDKAIALGSNLIITHEPSYYNHEDKTDWLQGDPVYQSKLERLAGGGVVLWRLHDSVHTCKQDMIVAGIERALAWEKHRDSAAENRYAIPSCTLLDLVQYVKRCLGIETVRVAGNPSMTCTGIGLLVGAQGGQVDLLMRPDIDVLMCGESSEWEACEYVRDSLSTARPKALIILGHQPSEEAGMAWITDWIRPMFPEIPITHIPAGNPLVSL